MPLTVSDAAGKPGTCCALQAASPAIGNLAMRSRARYHCISHLHHASTIYGEDGQLCCMSWAPKDCSPNCCSPLFMQLLAFSVLSRACCVR